MQPKFKTIIGRITNPARGNYCEMSEKEGSANSRGDDPRQSPPQVGTDRAAELIDARDEPASSGMYETKRLTPLESLSSPPRPRQRPTLKQNSVSSKRTRLLVFIKIILKCLDYEDPSLHLEAKQIVTDCTRKNREGIPGYDPLADAITRQLRMTVGEVHWNRAENLMGHYLKTHARPSNNVKVDAPKFAAV